VPRIEKPQHDERSSVASDYSDFVIIGICCPKQLHSII
jgi:hypothetical protein